MLFAQYSSFIKKSFEKNGVGPRKSAANINSFKFFQKKTFFFFDRGFVDRATVPKKLFIFILVFNLDCFNVGGPFPGPNSNIQKN